MNGPDRAPGTERSEEEPGGARPDTSGPAAAGGGSWQLPVQALWLLALPALAAAVWLRRRLVLARRARRMHGPARSRAALDTWVYLERLCQGAAPPPARLRELAEKAKFSNHVLTPEELGALTEYAGQCAARQGERERAAAPFLGKNGSYACIDRKKKGEGFGMEHEQIAAQVKKLTGKNNDAAYAALCTLEAESEASAAVCVLWDAFAAMLDDKRTYVRMRGMVLLACNAQWAGP